MQPRRDETLLDFDQPLPQFEDAPVARVGAKFTPIPFAPVMEEWVVPHAKDVFAAIKQTVGKE